MHTTLQYNLLVAAHHVDDGAESKASVLLHVLSMSFYLETAPSPSDLGREDAS